MAIDILNSKNRIMKHLLCFVFLFCVSSLYVHAQKSGDPDSSFEEDGAIYYPNFHGSCNTVIIQSDSKILIGGSGGTSSNSGLMVARFNHDGSIDNDFAENGIFILNTIVQNNKPYTVFAMESQSDGKILICGRFVQNKTTNANIGIIRLNQDGTLDNFFGENGIAIIDVDKYDVIADMTLLSDNKIVVAGTTGTYESAGNPEFVIRMLSNGSLDNNFGENGVVKTSYTNVIKVGAVSQQADGKILTSSIYGGSNQIQVVRYNINGTIDASFGTNGFGRIVPANGIALRINDMTIQDDGKILCAGALVIARFNNDGTPDLDFGLGDGYADLSLNEGYAEFKSVIVRDDKKIVLTGHYQSGIGTGVAAILYKKDGTLDSSFGENGLAISGFDSLENGTDISTGAGAIQPDGKIVIGGSFPDSEDQFFNISLFRFIGQREERYVHIK